MSTNETKAERIARMRRYRAEAFAEIAEQRPPDFALADLEVGDRKLLTPRVGEPETRTALRRVALQLARLFNSLKDQLFAHHFLSYFKTDEHGEISARTGQLSGMLRTYLSHAIAILSELGELIHGRKDVFESLEFRSALTTKHKRDWDRLVALLAFDGKPGNKTHKEPLGKYMNAIRNKVAFHFANRKTDDELGNAYDRRFSQENPLSNNTFVSFGQSMERTRFYFADAAIEEFFATALRESGLKNDDEVSDAIKDANEALRFVVEDVLRALAKVDGSSFSKFKK